MKRVAPAKPGILIVLLCAVILGGAANVPSTEPERDERTTLLERESRLENRIAQLRQERDFLLFRQVLQRSDSKYIVLDLASRTGMVKYRARVLRTFRIAKSGGPNGRPRTGVVTLTGKPGFPGKHPVLLFGDDIALLGRGGGRAPATVMRYTIGAKDLAALAYILEVGALAYIVR